MDVLVKDRKTGQEKTLPLKVYENLKHRYLKIGEVEPEQEELKKKDEGQKSHADLAVTNFHPPVVVQDGNETPIQVSTSPEVGGLTDEYKKLTGKNPDGRWSTEKLKAKIEELKNTTTVNTDAGN
jgi:hypothetical protein